MKHIINNNQKSEKIIKEKKTIKNRFSILYASLISFLAFTLICGLFYTVAVTITAQAIFPYEANGSIITVTLNDGTKKVYGSELVGQSYLLTDNNKNLVLKDKEDNYYLLNNDKYYLDENKNLSLEENENKELDKNNQTYYVYQGAYLIGRNNSGAPSNSTVTSEKYQVTIENRRDALKSIGYDETYSKNGIPSEMVTESGSGLDPEISYDTAIYQVKMIAKCRNISEEEVINIIDKYTKDRFLGIFGTKRVNVLMVNLALDGLL